MSSEYDKIVKKPFHIYNLIAEYEKTYDPINKKFDLEQLQKYIKLAVQLAPGLLIRLPEKYINYDITLHGVSGEHYGWQYEHIKPEYQTYEMLLCAISKSGWILRKLIEKNITPHHIDFSICYAATCNDPKMIEHVPNDIINYNMCKTVALEGDWTLLQFIPKQFKTDEIIDIMQFKYDKKIMEDLKDLKDLKISTKSNIDPSKSFKHRIRHNSKKQTFEDILNRK